MPGWHSTAKVDTSIHAQLRSEIVYDLIFPPSVALPARLCQELTRVGKLSHSHVVSSSPPPSCTRMGIRMGTSRQPRTSSLLLSVCYLAVPFISHQFYVFPSTPRRRGTTIRLLRESRLTEHRLTWQHAETLSDHWARSPEARKICPQLEAIQAQ